MNLLKRIIFTVKWKGLRHLCLLPVPDRDVKKRKGEFLRTILFLLNISGKTIHLHGAADLDPCPICFRTLTEDDFIFILRKAPAHKLDVHPVKTRLGIPLH